MKVPEITTTYLPMGFLPYHLGIVFLRWRP